MTCWRTSQEGKSSGKERIEQHRDLLVCNCKVNQYTLLLFESELIEQNDGRPARAEFLLSSPGI